MTWVLGCGTLFGYASLIADTRVSWPDGSTADLLQKIHPVGSQIMAGFSGSVLLGFAMVADMEAFFTLPPNHVWFPRIASWLWWRRGRRIFASGPEEEKDLGCSLLLAGVSAVSAEIAGHMALT